ncbi:hypothetical protein TD95_002779 [Thielaviopsis punctulata]|uniref:DFDF domain-containing protein n=1 Tax=Thielaviopsis punctulata TaxID=72032 RepID=A0A0F4ZG72_9PEZI|nr:hypothetical protein TD95_002779 [Thielaviopsis punctulata]
MSEFLGSRISLISKSNIRYVGTLHEINSEESTVSLENVQSFGTEGRESSGPPVAPSDQVYDYIVFRGSDVKDLRIEQPAAPQPQPPAVPNDPAILGARPRPDAQGPPSGPANQRPPQPVAPGAPGYGYNNNFYGAPGSWGRGGPMPGPGPGGYGAMPYHPNGWGPGGPGNYPPGPPGPSGPGGPGGPAPWGSYPYPPGMGPVPGGPGSMNGPPAAQPPKNQPTGPSEKKDQPAASSPPKPSAEGGKAVAPTKPEGEKSTPAAPKNGKAPTSASAPAQAQAQAPTTKFQPPVSATASQPKPTAAPSDAAINDATEAAKAAVALAMAKLNAAPEAPANPVDNLSKRVNDMRINANNRGYQNRGGRHHGGGRHHKIEVPSEDFDFASANAKFNKEEMKSPEQQAAPELDTAPTEEAEVEAAPVYNKSKSFFDNISSEAKERAANGGQKAGSREWRGEEQRKNIETFGQGSVDGGYRSNYRGRGRGGYRGRGRGGQNRGGYQNRQPRPYVEN